MKTDISRREFLKIAAAGTVITFLSGSEVRSNVLFRNLPTLTDRKSCSESRLSSPLAGRDLISWDDATGWIADTFERFAPNEIAFLLGLYPDHLNHLVQLIAKSFEGIRVLRYNPITEFQGWVTLQDAVTRKYGLSYLPLFDIDWAQLIFSFGSDLAEPWIAAGPGLLTAQIKRRRLFKRIVHFEARCSPAAASADEWIPIRPGSEAVLANAFARLIQDQSELIDLAAIAFDTGVPAREILRLASLFSETERRLALPGSPALNSPDGLAAGQTILGLNLVARELSSPGGLYLPPKPPIYPMLPHRPANLAEMEALAGSIRNGGVKALFLHNIDPIADLPDAYGWADLLASLERVISLSPIRNAATPFSHFSIPDADPTGSIGYQLLNEAADYGMIQLIQSDRPHSEDGRSSVNILLDAIHRLAKTHGSIDFLNESDFISSSVSKLKDSGGIFSADNEQDFFHLLLNGSWRRQRAVRFPPVQNGFPSWETACCADGFNRAGLRLHIYPVHSDIPIQAELHPATAKKHGMKPGDRVRVVTSFGEIQLPLSVHNGLHPDALAVPWHAGILNKPNPLDLIVNAPNESGGAVFSGLSVQIERIIQKR